MGEMAEYMLNGDDCSVCGEYLGDGPGYPRTCAACGGGDDDADFVVRAENYARWAAKRTERRQRRRQQREALVDAAATVIAEFGFRQMGASGHYQLFHRAANVRIDYWPTANKWSLNSQKAIGGTAANLSDYLRKLLSPAPADTPEPAP